MSTWRNIQARIFKDTKPTPVVVLAMRRTIAAVKMQAAAQYLPRGAAVSVHSYIDNALHLESSQKVLTSWIADLPRAYQKSLRDDLLCFGLPIGVVVRLTGFSKANVWKQAQEHTPRREGIRRRK